ncbi:low specificity L-threonine aldolase [Actinomadura logoneensis]|uniref:Low specificity L-threonine aldolase n=1 Tax=Actinomadura logoneensis TaxID=2293572 RepID=A0A372JCP5_9ACTN|nr:low specificity L-threonine aldolase [Actinomadura logoneensis]RFU37752.1 low specificity L-threonine aldolase [Actinomadura logoneensis]
MTSPDVHHGFGSDNHAGVHPEVMAALAEANDGFEVAYGSDAWTDRLARVVWRHFGPRATAYPVFNGTGANVVGLQAMCERWSSVICAESAHINKDECGASEHVGGLKLIPLPAEDGRLTPEAIARHATDFGNVQRSQPSVVSITQVTELGTVYTPDEIAAVASVAHERGLFLHMDGARLANAAVALGVPLRAITTDVGVDVLSFGGTKNGMMLGEMVVVLNHEAVRGTAYLRKSSMQLASKMRFLSAQFVALLDGDLWERNARHANAMARLLADQVREVPGVEIVRPVDANAVFARLPEKAAERLREHFSFHGNPSEEVRWMCAFSTTEADVNAFVAALRKSMGD